jgi:hypothetical protein
MTAPRSERLLYRKDPMRITNLKSPRPLPRPAPQRAETSDQRQPESRPQESSVDKFEAMLLEAREAWAAKKGRKSSRREPNRQVQRRLLPNTA